MLQAFFDVQKAEENADLFDGLAISRETELCRQHQGKYPVISLSFKNCSQRDILRDQHALISAVKDAISPFAQLIYDANQQLFPARASLVQMLESPTTSLASPGILKDLSAFLHQHYKQPCVILLDEYDVPLQDAFLNGFYDEMLPFVRALMMDTFKDNPHLRWGVITGCLKIAKESIFTGLNNPYVNTILNTGPGSERFGFTTSEVESFLDAAGLQECREIVRQWYDGYLFGETEIYNPLSVAFFISGTLEDPRHTPQAAGHWINTSGNDIIRSLLLSDRSARTARQMQELLDGGDVELPITENTVYSEFGSDPDVLWGTMLFTGYLKPSAPVPPGAKSALMRIPNHEVHEAIAERFMSWLKKDYRPVKVGVPLLDALLDGDTGRASEHLSRLLSSLISCRNFHGEYYQAFLHGILAGASADFDVFSDYPAGDGYVDLMVAAKDYSRCVLIEVKTTAVPDRLEETLKAAVRQFKERRYGDDTLICAQYTRVQGYAFACSRRECLVADCLPGE